MTDQLIRIAKKLRRESTDTERVLWQNLRAKQLDMLKFRRQQLIGQYIVDFVCFEKKIIIELDGGQHAQPEANLKDKKRDEWFEEQGYKVLRFWDHEVLTNIQGVFEEIRKNSS